MPNCPNDLLLTLFLEGQLSSDEALEIRRHLAWCQACAHSVAAGLVLQDLETVGALPAVEAREAGAATRRLAELTKARTRNAPTPGAPKDPESGLGSRLKDLFGGFVMAAAGLAEWQGSLGPMAHITGLAKIGKKSLDDAVRKDGLPASSLAKEDHDNASEESPTMTSPSPIQPVEHAPTQIGLPGADGRSSWVQQHYEDTSAIRCQELILRDFGVNVSEDGLRREAAIYGWYEPGVGTSLYDIGNLLELHSVPVHRYEDATIFNLTSELAQGHKVIVGVDSGELWYRNALLDAIFDKLGFSGADHAVVVSGIDTSDRNHIKVIVSDPGTGEVAASYPLEQFVDAWQDSGFFMVATQNPAPHWVPEMANFDYAKGHIDQVWGVDYSEFESLADQPQVWSDYLERALGVLETAGDGFGVMAGEDAAADAGQQPSMAGEDASIPTLLPDLADHLSDTCPLDHGGDDLQPDSGQHADPGGTDFDSENG